ncbi:MULTISPECIES: lipid-A-disaccharide synthase [Rhodomicrobium]|uniref:lipid-A-disaccharide synthase n=1 Tax=Rhodomicrobium TaxID=1068 RepID=UPI000B4B3C92|nr:MULTISPECIES: lipid-A-disaccharide synthase [Rhodomicrobium]
MKPRARRIFIVAGEHSGDLLGGKLMAAMKAKSDTPILFSGVGGEAMEAEGLRSIFPLADIAVMGPLAILARLPKLVRRVYQAVSAGLLADPDGVIIIDSPEFTHPVAKRIRKRLPMIPIIDYVSPSVWAWRPGRARKMRPYVDHLMAILPFEPEAHRQLGGPPCSYVGHPMIEKVDWINSLDAAELAVRLGLDPAKPVLLVLPGSRPTEVKRLMQPFGEAVRLLLERNGPMEVIIPAVASVRGLIEAGLADWPVRPHLVMGESDKFKSFRLAKAALAASGTVTLELGLSGVPMVVAYRVDGLAVHLRRFIKVPSIVLANLVIGENIFPEYIQEDCTGEKLTEALLPLLSDTAERQRQESGINRIAGKMLLDGTTPSERAAETAIAVIEQGIKKRLSVPR